MKVSVLSLKEKTAQHWFSYLGVTKNYFMTDPLNIIFDNFDI